MCVSVRQVWVGVCAGVSGCVCDHVLRGAVWMNDRVSCTYYNMAKM